MIVKLNVEVRGRAALLRSSYRLPGWASWHELRNHVCNNATQNGRDGGKRDIVLLALKECLNFAALLAMNNYLVFHVIPDAN